MVTNQILFEQQKQNVDTGLPLVHVLIFEENSFSSFNIGPTQRQMGIIRIFPFSQRMQLKGGWKID